MPHQPSPFGQPTIILHDDGPLVSQPLTEQILQEIRRSFPLRAPRPDDTIEKLMWAGGQQEVVEWVERYINQLLHPSQ